MMKITSLAAIVATGMAAPVSARSNDYAAIERARLCLFSEELARSSSRAFAMIEAAATNFKRAKDEFQPVGEELYRHAKLYRVVAGPLGRKAIEKFEFDTTVQWPEAVNCVMNEGLVCKDGFARAASALSKALEEACPADYED